MVNMNILQVLAVLQLLTLPAFTKLTQPVNDYWGAFGNYGPCSRTCGTGVAMRTRECITSRTDGGHNCVGSSKSFRTCNTHECPAGSKDFREEQCSQFDRMNFQGKRHTWIPYYGASNPCELNCVARGQNFFYRHRPSVVDGTPCYVGRTDICVDGFCRVLIHGEFMGLDPDTNSVHHAAPAVLALRPSVTTVYIYKTGTYGKCSVSCNGGIQVRSVECWVHDPAHPRVVDESYCITQRLQRPQSQQACNMHSCAAEYSVSSFSVCSVTCGEGQQRREVVCMGAGGEHMDDHACSGLTKPASVRTCRRPACQIHTTWHVTDYGLCTRSCGGGVRERKVGCFDTDLNPYPEARCGLANRPTSVETCNPQPCLRAQMVPSVQDAKKQESVMRGFVPHVKGEPSVSRPQTNMAYEHSSPVIGPYCAQSVYGCCPNGHTSAKGPRNEGCPQDDCVRTRYGCCLDGVTAARGFRRAGCPEYQTTVTTKHSVPPPPPPPALPSTGNVCSLPRDDGPCDNWMRRFYYDSATSKCTEFWYGSCHGNGNNFETMEACKNECMGMAKMSPPAPQRRGSFKGTLRARA